MCIRDSIQMPEMDGYETLRQIRAHPSCRLVPVVAITAFAMLDDRQKAFEAGFDGYFAKPIDIAALNLVLPVRDEIELLETIIQKSPGTEVILLTGQYSTDSALEAIQKG